MQSVTVKSIVDGWEPASVYERLKDSDVYEKFAPDQVKSVTSEPVVDGGQSLTHWEIYFRNGLLCWSERDFYDDEKCILRFEQVEGDFDLFEGEWAVTQGPGSPSSSLLVFTATFDFGVPSLEAIIDPVAIRVLRRAMGQIIGKLFGGILVD